MCLCVWGRGTLEEVRRGQKKEVDTKKTQMILVNRIKNGSVQAQEREREREMKQNNFLSENWSTQVSF